MNPTIDSSRRAARSGALTAGVLALVFPVAACGSDEPAAEPNPTSVSIAPSSPAAATSAPASEPATPTAPASVPTTGPSTAQSERVTDALGAVAAAQSAVADGTVVEASQDDDNNTVVWEVTVRVGDNGRELRIAADGGVLSNQSERLSSAQLGGLPKVAVTEAIEIAQKRVPDGEVTDVELSSENGQRVWDVSVDVARGDDWDLWIDAASGEVLREERD